jgi:hypothetical protein
LLPDLELMVRMFSFQIPISLLARCLEWKRCLKFLRCLCVFPLFYLVSRAFFICSECLDMPVPSFFAGFLSYSESWPVKMGPTRCPETSVNIYHTTPCNYPEDHRFHKHRSGSLKSKQLIIQYSLLRRTAASTLLNTTFRGLASSPSSGRTDLTHRSSVPCFSTCRGRENQTGLKCPNISFQNYFGVLLECLRGQSFTVF